MGAKMGGVDKIIENILSDSEEAAKQLLLQARSQADAIMEKAQTDARKKAAAAVSHAQTEAGETASRAVSIAALEGRKQMLAAKREVIDEVFDRLELYYMQLTGGEYVDFLASLAKGESGGEVIFSQKDEKVAKAVVEKLGSGFSLSSKTSDALKSGYIIKNGDIETNCSIQAVIEEKRISLEPCVAKILFAE